MSPKPIATSNIIESVTVSKYCSYVNTIILKYAKPIIIGKQPIIKYTKLGPAKPNVSFFFKF